MEIWETTGKDALDEALAETGNVVDLGETGMEAKEEWWYPDYVKEECPGLPDWKALNELRRAVRRARDAARRAAISAAPSPGAASTRSASRRSACTSRSSTPAPTPRCSPSCSRPTSARRRSSPGSTRRTGRRSKYKGEWVEFPEYEHACYDDPTWGTNPDMAYDCGKPHGWIKAVGWAGGEEKWPAAYEAIRKLHT